MIEEKEKDILTTEESITPVMGLILPKQTDNYNIDSHNYNSETIDKYISGLIDGAEGFVLHVENTDNPHQTTAHQVGAYTKEEVDAKDTAIQSSINAHKADSTNPHKVNKTQVGLGLVENLENTSEITDTATKKYATNLLAKKVYDYAVGVNSALSSHISRKDNPHSVSKDQVGLGNVQNYPIYGGIDLADNEKYASANAAKTAYDKGKSASDSILSHRTNFNNPHLVTAHQTGTYNYREIDDMIAKIEAGGFKQLDEHIADNTNPHRVSAAQVGAYTVSQTDTLIASNIRDHVSQHNPHKIVAKDIGLENVSNYGFYVGLDSDIDERYASAGSLKVAYDKTLSVEAELNDHMLNKDNPHSITAEQIDAFTKQEVLDIILENPGGGALEAHILNHLNPHKVSCEQIGALELTGGTITGSLSIEQELTTPLINVEKIKSATEVLEFETTGDYIEIQNNNSNGDLNHTTTITNYGVKNACNGVVYAELIGNTMYHNSDKDKFNNIAIRTRSNDTIGSEDFVSFMSYDKTNGEFRLSLTNDKDAYRSFIGVPKTSDLTSHTSNKSNPHGTTAEQLGVYTIVQTDTLVNEKVKVHTDNVNNPHKVTKSQVGLGNVANYPISGDIDLASDSYYATAGAVKKAYDRANSTSNTVQTNLNTHIADVNNPHKITKAQVGLTNVQNYEAYSDINSTSTTLYATAAAVNKAATTRLPLTGGALTGPLELKGSTSNITLPHTCGVKSYLSNGTTTTMLHIGADDKLHLSDSRDIVAKGNINVTGTINGSKVFNAVWNDYAEYFPKDYMYETEPGDIIALKDDIDEEIYELATESNSVVVGVHSGEYGHLIGGEQQPVDYTYEEWNKNKFIPVGLAGRVHVKFIGEAKKGMKVVPSTIPGVGREYDPQTDSYDKIIGYLVESNNDSRVKKVRMKIGK